MTPGDSAAIPDPQQSGTLDKPVPDLSRKEAEAEHEALAREIKKHDELYYQEDAPSSPTRRMTGCVRAIRLWRSISRTCHGGRPISEGRRGSVGKIRQSHARDSHAVARECVQRRRCGRICGARPPFPRTGRNASRNNSGAENRRAFVSPALRKWKTAQSRRRAATVLWVKT